MIESFRSLHCLFEYAGVATEQPMQTLQLNTRLSNKSWVRVDFPSTTN